MGLVIFLAQNSHLDYFRQSIETILQHFYNLNFPTGADFIDLVISLGPLQSIFLLLAGAVCLFCGFRVFQVLVIVNAAVIGLLAGMFLGSLAGFPLVGAVIGAVVLGVLAWPLLRFAMIFMAALAGGVIGYAVWHSIALSAGGPAQLAWIGGLIGLAALAVLAIVLFRPAVIVFTCAQGAVLIAAGLLGLLFLNADIRRILAYRLSADTLILTLSLAGLALLGFFFQMVHTSAKPSATPAKA